MTPDTGSQESGTLRVLRWYGLGASTASYVWAGFRRATITAALLALVVMTAVSLTADGDARTRDAVELVYVMPATWVVYVAMITIPGVFRVTRRHRSHS